MAIEDGLDLVKIPSQLNVFLSGDEERKKDSVQQSKENIEYLEGLQQAVNTQFKEWAPYSDETFDDMQVLIASAQIIRETPKAVNSAYEFFSQNKNKHITVLPSNSNSGKYITESTSDNQFNLNNNSKALLKETSNVATNNKSNVPAVYNRDSILLEVSEQNNGGLVNKTLNKNIPRIANNNGNNSSIVSLKENGGSAKGSSGSIAASEGQKQLASGKKIAGNGEKSEKSIGDIISVNKGGNKTNSGFKYKHNPSDNPKVLKDAIEDPNAVYGYRPSEDGSLASFVKGEWDDPIAVEGYRQDRIAYHNRNEGAAQQMVSNMFSEGASTEDVARAVNEYRNQSRIQAYIDSNGNIKNIDGYNAALVRAEKNSYENLIKSGKTPEQIIKSATKGNPGMDACTGLYDEYFDTY